MDGVENGVEGLIGSVGAETRGFWGLGFWNVLPPSAPVWQLEHNYNPFSILFPFFFFGNFYLDFKLKLINARILYFNLNIINFCQNIINFLI